MNLEKLKDTARKYESKEDWRRAIEVYLRAIQEFESGREVNMDLSLYNRVGDLYLKVGDQSEALRSYERAVDLYGEQGFLNNAIALCGKILRVDPGRVTVYLSLAHLHARKNVLIEAKRNLLEYIERMNAAGRLDEAFRQVGLYADQHAGDPEIRLMLIELLRASSRSEEARIQLQKLAGDLEATGDSPSAQATRDRMDEIAREEAAGRSAAPPAGLVFLDTGFATPPRHAPPVDGLMPTGEVVEPEEPVEPLDLVPTSDELAGIETTPELADLEPTALDAPPGEDDLVLESPPLVSLDAGTGFERPAEPLDGLLVSGAEDLLDEPPADVEPLDLDRPEADGIELVSTGAASLEPVELEPFEEEAGAPLEFLDTGAEPVPDEAGEPIAAAAPDRIAELEDRILEDPDDPAAHRELGEALLEVGDRGRGVEELELALRAFERREAWDEAAGLAERLVALEPDEVGMHQKRVELTFRLGVRSRLLAAYLDLADLLVRQQAPDKAAAVYRRVLEHEPGNAHARTALDALEPPAAPPAPASAPAASFVDLGAMIIDEGGPRDTRMRVEQEQPTGDEQKDFEEMLAAFKRGIEQNLASDDFQTHYDLGVAFKEMGLLDEAIAEFQKALRAPEGRLRTSEALGQSFYEKGQFAIAETILRRAVEGLAGGDDEKIGLLYWLGRACEEQAKRDAAVAAYERALAVDIRFRDINDRIHRLTAGQRQ